MLQQTFDQAVTDSRTLPERPDNATLLKMYALYKQASQGDVADDAPAMADFVARAKWEAWNNLKGVPQDQAKQDYIDLISGLSG